MMKKLKDMKIDLKKVDKDKINNHTDINNNY